MENSSLSSHIQNLISQHTRLKQKTCLSIPVSLQLRVFAMFALLLLQVCIALTPSPKMLVKDQMPGNTIRAALVIAECFTQLFFFCYQLFFPSHLTFFPRVEQIQCNWQKIGKLQRSRGSDFSSKQLNGVYIFFIVFSAYRLIEYLKKKNISSKLPPSLILAGWCVKSTGLREVGWVMHIL